MAMPILFRVILVAALLLVSALFELGSCIKQQGNNSVITMKIGAGETTLRNDPEIENLARFAVKQHNNKENSLLELVRVLKAKEQVVAGKVYYLTLEAIDAGQKKIYDAKILVKPWMNFKQLQEFKRANVISPYRSSDLSVKQEAQKSGSWHAVSIHDPKVKDAANYALKSIAQRSNSLYPYELLEVVQAKTKVIEDYAKFNLLLKVSRGIKDERFRIEINKLGGRFYFCWMEQDHS